MCSSHTILYPMAMSGLFLSSIDFKVVEVITFESKINYGLVNIDLIVYVHNYLKTVVRTRQECRTEVLV